MHVDAHAGSDCVQSESVVIGMSVVEFAELQRLSGYERRADVERWAASIGLPTKPCRGGVWTTVEAINQSLGVMTAARRPCTGQR